MWKNTPKRTLVEKGAQGNTLLQNTPKKTPCCRTPPREHPTLSRNRSKRTPFRGNTPKRTPRRGKRPRISSKPRPETLNWRDTISTAHSASKGSSSAFTRNFLHVHFFTASLAISFLHQSQGFIHDGHLATIGQHSYFFPLQRNVQGFLHKDGKTSPA